MMAATVTTRTPKILQSLWQSCNNNCRFRKYSYRLYFCSRDFANVALRNVTRRKLLDGTNSTSGDVHYAAAFSRSSVFRATNITEPGSALKVAPQVLDPFKLAGADLQNLFLDIQNELRTKNANLFLLSSYYFDGKGKAIRPVIMVLMSRALNYHLQGSDSLLLPPQNKIAMIVEMIHAATLAHDDVIDSAVVRRGKPSINAIWGQRKAVLAGDYITASATQLMARIGSVEVLKAFSQVLDDVVSGEFMQLGSKENEDERFSHYLLKSFKKTASLIACGCKCAGIMGGGDESIQELAFQYGRNIGIAFQLIDDLLDFVSSAATLGKAVATDLKLGLATAPVLFARETYPELDEMILRRFSKPGDCEKAFNAVMKSNGLAQTRFLAEQHCNKAIKVIQHLAPSPEKKALYNIAETVLSRTK